MRRRARSKYAYLWVTLVFFALSLGGHWGLAYLAFANEAEEHGQTPKTREFLIQIGRDTFENWQSEFLQLIWQVAGLAYLWYVGSPQSKEGGDRLEGKIDFLLSQLPGGEECRRTLDREFPRR